MSKRSRVIFSILWALSLAAAAQWGASARQQARPGEHVITGADFGFRIEGATGPTGHTPYGKLVVRLGGEWQDVVDDTGRFTSSQAK